jgi:hypothetical protein
VFKRFLAHELEFAGSLSLKEAARFVPANLAAAGVKGMIYTAPIYAVANYFSNGQLDRELNKAVLDGEEWALVLKYGVASLLPIGGERIALGQRVGVGEDVVKAGDILTPGDHEDLGRYVEWAGGPYAKILMRAREAAAEKDPRRKSEAMKKLLRDLSPSAAVRVIDAVNMAFGERGFGAPKPFVQTKPTPARVALKSLGIPTAEERTRSDIKFQQIKRDKR